MPLVGFVSADHVVEAFRGDSKVLEISSQWPDTPFMRIVLLPPTLNIYVGEPPARLPVMP
jgi:hypothetical protein